MATLLFNSGRLRHRVDIQSPVEVQDDVTGEIKVTGWADFAANVAAEIAPLSAREFMESQALQSVVATRITVRYRVGITAKMRCRHDDGKGTVTYYQLAGAPIRDPNQGLEWLTLPCASGVYDG